MLSGVLLAKFLNMYSYFHRKTKALGEPQIFNIETTNLCPMDCVMCPRRHMKRKLGHMDFNLYKKIINQIKGNTYSIWLHHFGDPLMHPELYKFIEYAEKNKVKTKISINPGFLTKEIGKKIIDAKLTHLHISLDGTNDAMYKKLRGRNADYNKAIENINEFLKLKKGKKPYVSLAMIHMKETKDKIEEFRKKWDVKGIDKVEIKEFTTWDGSDKEIIKLAEDSQKSEGFQKSLKYPCVRPWHRMTVLWDGRVVPCCFDYDGKYILGDLNKESLKEIWNGKQMRKLRKQHITNNFEDNELCKNCKEKYVFEKNKD